MQELLTNLIRDAELNFVNCLNIFTELWKLFEKLEFYFVAQKDVNNENIPNRMCEKLIWRLSNGEWEVDSEW